MWERVELPGLTGPILGFTFPRGDVLLVLTPGGLVRVALDPVAVGLVAGPKTQLYDPVTGFLVWEGERHLVYDADGGDITSCDHRPSGDRIVMAADGALLIMDPAEREVRQRIDSIRLPSGDGWMFAGFSHDDRWLIAGEPAGVQVFRRVSNAGDVA